MKSILLILLVCSLVSFGYGVNVEHTRSQQKHIDELQKSKWGRTILEMASLHALSKGPVQELVQAIEDLIADLQQEIAELEHNFDVRTNEHNSDVRMLEQDISDAVIDIQRTQDTLEGLLRPRREQLKKKIAQIKQYQQANRKKINEMTLVRSQEQAEYETQLSDYNSAVEASDLALNLLASLSNPSLAQIKEFHVSLHRIQQKIKPHSREAPLIKALIALASEQNFSDQGIIRQIITMMNEFRVSIVDALNASIQAETERVEEFNQRVEQLDLEFAEFGRQIIKINIDLTAVTDKINDLTAFSSQRDQDRQTFQAQLDLENATYAEETEIYTDLRNQYLRETAVAEEGHRLVTSVDFSGLVY